MKFTNTFLKQSESYLDIHKILRFSEIITNKKKLIKIEAQVGREI